jgi:hypothetical protein
MCLRYSIGSTSLRDLEALQTAYNHAQKTTLNITWNSSMNEFRGQGSTAARLLHWIARLTAIAAIVPLMQIVIGESGSGPVGPREWIYLALFPFGFSAGYLLGWRWPLVGGCISLVCMAASQLVIGRILGIGPYIIWGVLCVPGMLYIIAGCRLREQSRSVLVAAAGPIAS